jgi:hypothetical protein
MSGSLLDQLFGQIESGNNPYQGLQPTGTIGGQFQQSYGFQQQFGGNTSGSTILDPTYQQTTLDNFVAQVLGANPNISVGDAYAEYNLGSGTPGSGPTVANLSSSVLSNLNNAASGLGVNPASSLASIAEGTAAAPGTAAPATTGATGTPAATTQSSCGTAFNPANWPCYVFNWSVIQRLGYGFMGFLLIAFALVIYALRTRDQG